MLDDIRYALRGMARTPGFTAVAVLMIALGTGANAAMFSIIDGVMLRSPFSDSDRIAIARVAQPGHGPTAAISVAQYRSLAESAPAFEAIAATGGGQRPIIGGLGDLRRFNVECVTGGMFRVLGATTLAGRTFTPEEDRPGAPAAVVISYDFWKRELAGAPDAVGRALSLSGVPTTIVGIMPRRFGGPYSRNNNDGWLPLGPALGGTPTPGCQVRASVNVFVRIRPGLTLGAASEQAGISAAIDRIPDAAGQPGAKLSLVPIEEQTFDELRTPFLALLGAVGLVLLIACGNVANLQLERVFGRRREFAVRMAIGATRRDVLRQTLTENLVLYAAGCAGGLLIAAWTLHLIVGLLPAYVPHVNEIEINGRILAATLLVSCVAGLVIGLIPAVQASSPSLMDDLRVSTRSSAAGGAWIRRALVVAQIALSLTLLVGASLMIRTFLTLRPTQPGFHASDKVTASVRLQGPSAAAPVAFFTKAFDRLRAIPGVQEVAGSTYLPMSGSASIASAIADGQTVTVWRGIVTANYFGEMDIPVLHGRTFDAHDDASGAPVAIVNDAMARRVWPAGTAIGQMVTVQAADAARTTREIVGVLRDTRSVGGDLKARPELYVPFAQSPVAALNLIVRTTDPRDPRLAGALRSAVAAVDPTQVVDRIAPLQDTLDSGVSTPRFGAWVLGLFAAMAVLLAAVGLAASVAWWVTRRTREIGVRVALGARATDVARMVVGQTAALAAGGIVFGLAGAAASTRLLEGWLYGVTPLDVPTFAWSAGGMLLIALVASYLPARRAARVDPLVALRAE
jgi:putative ABC transport system permease protein